MQIPPNFVVEQDTVFDDTLKSHIPQNPELLVGKDDNNVLEVAQAFTFGKPTVYQMIKNENL